jgi:hypothetical protein
MSWIRRAAMFAGIAWITVVVGLFVFQRDLLYVRRPPARMWQPAETTGAGLPVLRVAAATPAAAGASSATPPPSSPATTAVAWFHGNGQQIGQLRHLAEALGTDVLLVEYPGYDGAPGEPTEDSILEGARAALALLGPRPTCGGYSLGTGVAAAMAAEGRCGRLVLVAPYTSIAAVAQSSYWFVPAYWLVRDRWDTLARAPSIHVPTLVINGDADEVVPPEMGRTVAAAIGHATLRTFPGKGHVSVLTEEVLADIGAFARGSGAE